MNLSEAFILNKMKQFNITGAGIAVIKDGKLADTHCFGLLEAGTTELVDRHSIFNACSISKFVTAIVVMKFVSQGDLDLDEDINNKLVSWTLPVNEYKTTHKVTLRHLLSHHSGILDPEGSFDALHSQNDGPNMVDILEGKTPYCRESITVKKKPGSEFHYSDAGYCVVQQLIEDIAGEPFEKAVNDLIFEPLHMDNSTFSQSLPNGKNFTAGHDKEGNVIPGKYPIYPYAAASGLWTTPSDLVRLVIELMDALNHNSKIGLTSDAAKPLLSPQGTAAWAGLGLFLDSTDHETEISSLGWGIGYQSMLVAQPYLKKGIIIMTNTDTGLHQMKGFIGEIYRAWV
ncbi:serine hydrolase domain-containing protein [Jeotgalibacillus aurantiacus]|uniref:serine hydrolase domain-containing protein n=1 Tax=Jeotgalibacillus aurantiacus TaxID=2763266 RepID=UPI001D0A282D|nr:serine hydrolase domain-containing protein [Jeotgalibacillus aurantiacus]